MRQMIEFTCCLEMVIVLEIPEGMEDQAMRELTLDTQPGGDLMPEARARFEAEALNITNQDPTVLRSTVQWVRGRIVAIT